MEKGEHEMILLRNVISVALGKVIPFLDHHKDDSVPKEDDENKKKRTDDISSWDANFLKVHQKTLFYLIFGN